MERTLSVLVEYRRLMDAHDVVRARLVATSAARDAENAPEFLAAAGRVVGTTAEVLTGDEEGWFSFVGATGSLPPDVSSSGPVLVVDIGGGSTELVVGRPPRDGHATLSGGRGDVVTRSLDIGCVRISERLLLHDPPLAGELTAARTVVEAAVESARDEMPVVPAGTPVIGLAGTVSTLVSLDQGFEAYDRARVHHAIIDRQSVTHWLDVLATEPSRARLEHPGMVAGREEVIVAGALILDVVMAAFGSTRCVASEDDILDGLAADLLGRSRSHQGR